GYARRHLTVATSARSSGKTVNASRRTGKTTALAAARTSEAGRESLRLSERLRLAARARVRRAVHERVAAHRGTAARARLPRPPVHGERPVEVPALAVDVHV